MASPQPANTGSDGDLRYANLDDRKRKRMISNRESARRSRAKKQQRLDELLGEINQLQNDNNKIMRKIDGATQVFVGVASQNNVLRAQLSELTDRLHSLNSVLHIAQEHHSTSTCSSIDISHLSCVYRYGGGRKLDGGVL
ncbi:unnamed protein product [Lactuca saligna]|uniref:BZIP domain-containing protein n=1 Tax=Lactuca saligna TaxID=75948 RepID=A0AA35XZC5_LACSI|nr:unnamed protein product [Lactuca saligna]